MRLIGDYDHTAYAWVKVNLVLACVAAAAICTLKTAMLKEELLVFGTWAVTCIGRAGSSVKTKMRQAASWLLRLPLRLPF